MVYKPAQRWGNVPSVNKTSYADANGRKDIVLYFVMQPTWIPTGAIPHGQPTDFGHNFNVDVYLAAMILRFYIWYDNFIIYGLA